MLGLRLVSNSSEIRRPAKWRRPTDGLDPNQKELVRELVREMKSGRTIILSTHILEEAEELCDRAVVISRGAIVEDAKIDQLVDASGRLASRFRQLTLDV